MEPDRREQIRRRMSEWSAVAARERAAIRQQPRLSPEQAFAAFMELLALARPTLHVEDPVRKREVEQTRCAWSRLRAKLS